MTALDALTERVRFRGASLFVRSVGRRATVERAPLSLVTVHGGPGLSSDYLDGLEILAEERRVLRWDQRGSGRTGGELPFTPELLDTHAADLEAVLDASGATRVHLLGHSFGGLVAAAYALAHPERVASLVFVDSAPPHAGSLQKALRRVSARVALLQRAGTIPHALPDERGDDASAWLAAVAPAFFADVSQAGRVDPGAYRGDVAHATLRALTDFDLRPGLSAITVPTLAFACGTPFGDAGAQMFDAVPNAPRQLCTLASSGHLPWLEAPSAFFDTLRAFMRECDLT